VIHQENERTTLVYRGNGVTVGDLKCERVRPGMIRSFWKPDDIELGRLMGGGVVELVILTEPIPPVGLNVITEEDARREYSDVE
jgi:hypothetical protein